MKLQITCLLFLLIATGFSLRAQNSSEEDHGEAAANATNPLAFVTKMQVQPNFTWKGEDAHQLNLTMRIIQPSQSIGLPFIKSKNPSKVYTLYRLEAPLIGQTFPESPALNATGISDLIILDVIAFKQNWGLLGVGPSLIIPTGQGVLGGGKWDIGLSAVALNTKTKGLQWGALIQQYKSFAGDDEKPDQNFMLFQPIVNKILKGGYFVQFNPIMNFNWENKTYNIPMTLAFGKAFAKNLSAFIAPEYVISGPQEGDFTLRFQLNAMFPPGNSKK